MKKQTAIIIVPPIVGTSLSVWIRHFSLIQKGYKVRVFDLFKNQEFKRPFFLKIILDTFNEAEKCSERVVDGLVLSQLDKMTKELQEKHKKVFFMAFGMGTVYALKYAEQNHFLKGIVVWYPHWVYPSYFPKNSPNPDLITTPVLQFVGTKDTMLPEGSLEFIQRLSGQRKNITTKVFQGAGHAFADFTIQYFVPNPLWKPRASKDSWNTALK